MTNEFEMLSHVATESASDEGLQEAIDCLDRFTDRFNACDAVGMDRELHFPHTMLSGSHRIDWPVPGSLQSDFFDALKKSAWHHTRYEQRQAVLTSSEKVHFIVTYSRRDADDVVLSMHANLWIVTRIDDRWGIALRSY